MKTALLSLLFLASCATPEKGIEYEISSVGGCSYDGRCGVSLVRWENGRSFLTNSHAHFPSIGQKCFLSIKNNLCFPT